MLGFVLGGEEILYSTEYRVHCVALPSFNPLPPFSLPIFSISPRSLGSIFSRHSRSQPATSPGLPYFPIVVEVEEALMAWEAGYRDVGWKLSPTCPFQTIQPYGARRRRPVCLSRAKRGQRCFGNLLLRPTSCVAKRQHHHLERVGGKGTFIGLLHINPLTEEKWQSPITNQVLNGVEVSNFVHSEASARHLGTGRWERDGSSSALLLLGSLMFNCQQELLL